MAIGFERKNRWVTPSGPYNLTALLLPIRRKLVSFLSRRTGCKPWPVPDDNERPPTPAPPPCSVTPADCQFRHRLRRKAKTCVKFLEQELGLKRAYALPSRICCGQLRSAVRRSFGNLNVGDELSFKTTQKVEKSFCQACQHVVDEREEKWKEARFQTSEVDRCHLEKFVAQFHRNVERGWNKGKWPYIPNGHACLGSARKEGGTWRKGDGISNECEIMSVVSAGKPRIVTLYSETNTSVLHDLHHALYSSLSRKGWLLRGEPTEERVASLNGGKYISVDYIGATDNIKIAYTSAAIEALIDKGEGLTEEQKQALRVVGSLEIDGEKATVGQPMGSMVSFPLLCLINKTVVDLSLNDFLIEGKIAFKEWTRHRCLINGDDLLTRDVRPGGLFDRIQYHGTCVGLYTNREKTMVDAEEGEINSTLFKAGIRQKKTNCGALFMGAEEADVIGFADRSCQSDKGFIFCVRRALAVLSRQETKLPSKISLKRWKLVLKDREICSALRAQYRREQPTNPFPTVAVPDGYYLSREEMCAAAHKRVVWLRSQDYVPPKKVSLGFEKRPVSLRQALKRTSPTSEVTLKVFVDAWVDKLRKNIEDEAPFVDVGRMAHVCDTCADRSEIDRMVCEIREFKRVYGPLVSEDPAEMCDFISVGEGPESSVPGCL